MYKKRYNKSRTNKNWDKSRQFNKSHNWQNKKSNRNFQQHKLSYEDLTDNFSDAIISFIKSIFVIIIDVVIKGLKEIGKVLMMPFDKILKYFYNNKKEDKKKRKNKKSKTDNIHKNKVNIQSTIKEMDEKEDFAASEWDKFYIDIDGKANYPGESKEAKSERPKTTKNGKKNKKKQNIQEENEEFFSNINLEDNDEVEHVSDKENSNQMSFEITGVNTTLVKLTLNTKIEITESEFEIYEIDHKLLSHVRAFPVIAENFAGTVTEINVANVQAFFSVRHVANYAPHFSMRPNGISQICSNHPMKKDVGANINCGDEVIVMASTKSGPKLVKGIVTHNIPIKRRSEIAPMHSAGIIFKTSKNKELIYSGSFVFKKPSDLSSYLNLFGTNMMVGNVWMITTKCYEDSTGNYMLAVLLNRQIPSINVEVNF